MRMQRSINDVNNRKIKGGQIKYVKFIDEETIEIRFKSEHYIVLESKSTGYGGETGIFIVKDTLRELSDTYDY